MPTKNHNLLLHRAFQYLGIILIVGAMGGGYWYWKQAQAGLNLQSDQEGALSNGLVGYWPFDGNDISGTTAYDRSGQGNNGTLTNSPTKVTGTSGQAINFDGTNQYVNMGNVLDIGSGDVTLSIWAKPPDSDQLCDMMIGKRQSTAPYPQYQMMVGTILSDGNCTASKKVSILFYNGTVFSSAQAYATAQDVVDGNWHHIVGTRSGSTVKIYVDGLDMALATVVGGAVNTTTNTGNFTVGYNNTSYYYNGSIDEPRIYNRVLSENEIWDLYQMGNPDKVNSTESQGDSLEKGMVGYWKLDDASGTSAADASGNANTGTLTNGPTWTTGQIGGATDFDGTDDYVQIPSDTKFDSSVGTWSFWAKTDTLGVTTPDSILFRADSGSSFNGVNMYVNVSGRFGFQIKNASLQAAGSADTTVTANDGLWHHVVLSWTMANGGINRLYVDGQETRTATNTAAWNFNSQNIRFADASDAYWEIFDGKLDEVRIYNRTLSAEEVAKLYKTTAPDDPDTGLVGYWPFNGKDIAGTTAYDRSGKGGNGVLTNSPTKSIGKVGQAMSFNGTNSDVVVNDSAAISPTTALSYSFWAKRTDASGSRAFFTKSDGGGGRRSLAMSSLSTGAIRFFTTSGSNSTGPYSSTGASVTRLNEWSHIVAVFDGAGSTDADRAKIYVDGIQQTLTFSGTIPATVPDVATNLLIGGSGDAGDYGSFFLGSIDEFRMYNRVLSASEIWDLYQAGNPDKVNSADSQGDSLEKGIVGYWKLDDASGTSASDSSGNANTGTLTNGPTWTTGHIGGATSFDGTNDYIQTASVSDSQIGSVSMWVKPNFNISSDAYYNVFENVKPGGCDSVSLYFNAYSGYNRWYSEYKVNCGGTIVSFGNSVLSDTVLHEWQHLVLIWNATKGSEIFVNGASVGRTTGTTGSANFTAQTIGMGGFGIFKGDIDEVRIYNRTLSAEEVTKLYRTTAPDNPDTGLVGYWPFDGKDISGTTAFDRSGKGNNGTLTNGPTRAIGKIGQGLDFDGTDDHMNLGSGVSIDNLSIYSISAWIRPSALGGPRGFISKDYGWKFFAGDTCSRTDIIGLRHVRSTTYGEWTAAISNVIRAGEWQHVTMTYDGTSVSNDPLFYINGSVTSSYECSTPVGTLANDSGYAGAIGGNGYSEWFPGDIDEVRIYNRILTQAEVTALYNAGR